MTKKRKRRRGRCGRTPKAGHPWRQGAARRSKPVSAQREPRPQICDPLSDFRVMLELMRNNIPHEGGLAGASMDNTSLPFRHRRPT